MVGGEIARARSLQELGRHHEALDLLRTAAQADPSSATVQSLRAVSLAGIDDFEEAIRTAHVALQLSPTDPFGQFVLAKILTLKGDFLGARKSIRAALEMAPDVADYHALLANTYAFENRWSRALEAVHRGLQIDPANRACVFLNASVLSFTGRRSEALRTVERHLQIDPHDASMLALYESLQRDAGVADVASLSLQANPTKSYVRSVALDEILRRTRLFRWVVTMERMSLRISVPWLLLLLIACGLLLWLSLSNGWLRGDAPLSSGVRAAYSVLLFAFVFGRCIADIYLRVHRSGRWLLSAQRRKGAETVAAGLALAGSVLVAGALTQSRDLMFVGAGIAGGGLIISRSLAPFLRWPAASEFGFSLVASSAALVAVAAAGGLWNRRFIVTLATCGVLTWAARLAGWPRPP